MLRSQSVKLCSDVLGGAEGGAEHAEATLCSGEFWVPDPGLCTGRRRKRCGPDASSVPHAGLGGVQLNMRLSKQVVLQPAQKMCDARRW